MENVGQLLNFGHLETAKSNFNKIGWPKPELCILEKGWFNKEQNNSTLRAGRKQGAPEPLGLSFGHLSELRKVSYLKGIIKAFIWFQVLEYFCWNKPVVAWLYFVEIPVVFDRTKICFPFWMIPKFGRNEMADNGIWSKVRFLAVLAERNKTNTETLH